MLCCFVHPTKQQLNYGRYLAVTFNTTANLMSFIIANALHQTLLQNRCTKKCIHKSNYKIKTTFCSFSNEFVVDHIIVVALLCKQFFWAAFFHQLASFYHHNLVCSLQGPQLMGDENGCATFLNSAQGLLDNSCRTLV